MSTIEKRDEAIDLARYKQAAEEIETGNRDDALWYKAFADGGGDENATKAAYIRLRVEQLRGAAVAASAVRVTATQPSPAYTPATPTAKPNGAKNLYDVLGIPRGASDEQILAAYQKQVAILYAQDNQDAEAKNKLIFTQHAKEVLLDPAKRAAYDARITAEAAQPEKVGCVITPKSSPADASEPLSDRDLYAAYLGEKNQAYYLEKFERFDRLGDGMHISWNWPAFITFLFGATWWALYRKLYAWFFALLVYGAILLAMTYSRIDAIAAFAFVFSVASATAFGMFANVIYYHKVKGKIAAAQRIARDDNELIYLLREKGSIHSWVWWVLWIWLVVAVIGIIAAIAIPAYSDYTKKAKAQASGNVPQFASDSQRQPNQPLNQDAGEQALRVTTSAEKEQIAAREESDRIKWLFNAKNYEGIVQEFTSGKKFFFDDFYKIGTAFYKTGKYAQAADIFLQAEKKFPADSLIKNGLGNCYFSLGDMTNAIKKYQEAEALLSNEPVIKSNLGSAYYAAGDHPNAIKKYREALALDPYNHQAQKGIKETEQDQARIADEAKQQADDAKRQVDDARRQAAQERAHKAAEKKAYEDIFLCKTQPEVCR